MTAASAATAVPGAVSQDPGGQSTPGVTVTAQNPGTSALGSSMRITLTAHTDKSAVPDPSCRPQDATLRCTASLVLAIPAAGGLSVTGFDVHRVAVGTTSCGDENCGGDALTAAAAGVTVPATVRGVAVLVNPGATGLPSGSTVQVFIDLTDNGTAQYADQARVRVRPFTEGQDKSGWSYDSGWQTIQQVRIHVLGSN
ncbi:MAG: hypothetical protein ACYCVZ_13920 [Streptosporangiaceae bacterium]